MNGKKRQWNLYLWFPHKHDTYIEVVVRFLGESLEMEDLYEIILDFWGKSPTLEGEIEIKHQQTRRVLTDFSSTYDTLEADSEILHLQGFS